MARLNLAIFCCSTYGMQYPANMRKIRVALLFGGKSAEHEVSLVSAGNIAEALNPKKYALIPIYVTRSGAWIAGNAARRVLKTRKVPTKTELSASERVAYVPGGAGLLVHVDSKKSVRIDVAFPVLHGPNGEDGSVQGALKVAGVPYVGAGVLGSAVGMDKDVMKRLLKEAGIPVVPFLTLRRGEKVSFGDMKKQFGVPMFVKPANLGSSVGVSKVTSEKEYRTALALAFRYDTKVLVEKGVQARELECAVCGNEKPRASRVGEVVPTHDFYSYDAKYVDENGALLFVPADIPARIEKEIQSIAARAYQALGCEGMGRVDCFLTRAGKVLVNEINTIPGFTAISMYPKLWSISGMPTQKLLDVLIALALRRARAEQGRATTR
jgi:D-alanine-D-alanine ligase